MLYLNSNVIANNLIRSYLTYCKPLYSNIFDVAIDNIFNLKYQELDKYNVYLSLESKRIKIIDSVLHKINYDTYKQDLCRSSFIAEYHSALILRNQYKKLINKIKRYNNLD